MNLPSRELLSNVFNTNVDKNSISIDADNCISFNSGKEKVYPYFLISPKLINIYELAHKCKEWAFNQNYTIRTAKWDKDYYEAKILGHYLTTKKKLIKAITEPEAVFKACDYILKEK